MEIYNESPCRSPPPSPEFGDGTTISQNRYFTLKKIKIVIV